MHSSSSPGLFGFHHSLIKQLCEISDAGDEFVKYLALFLSRIANGALPSCIINILTIGVLIPTEKRNGGIRPIVVNDIFRKLATKLMMFSVRNDMQRFFSGLQYGVGRKNGLDKIVHTVKTMCAVLPHYDVLLLDFQNAFNTISRVQIRDSLVKHCPELLGYFDSVYIHQDLLLFIAPTSAGNSALPQVISSCEGVQQGDVLGPLFFSIATYDIFKKIQDLVHKDIDNRNKSGLALAYLDDLTVIGSHETCITVLELLQSEGPQIGLHLNLSKTSAVPSDLNYSVASRAYNSFSKEITIIDSASGFEVLGVPFGSLDYIHNRLQEFIDTKFIQAAEIVKKFPDPQVQFQYYYWVLLHKTNYLFRTLPTSVLEEGFISKIEDILKAVFKEIFELDDDEFKDIHWSQACLPIKEGGFGVGSIGHTAYCAFSASFIIAFEEMNYHLPKEDIFGTAYGLHCIDCVEKVKEAAQFPDRYVLETILARRPQQMESMQKEFYGQFKRQLVKKYQAYINESSHSYVNAKTYSSSSIIGGAYLLANPSTRSRFTKTEFLMAARWRLGIDLKHFPSKFICRCKDNTTKKAPFGAHGEHCFVCKEGRGRNKRHHSIRDILYQLIKDAKLNCESEPENLFIMSVDEDTGKPCKRRPDLLVQDVPFDTNEEKVKFYKDTIIDVSVTYPCSDAAIRNFKSDQRKGAAAARIFDAKYNKYAEVAGDRYKMIPFVLETFGYIHPKSEGFLRHLIGVAADKSGTDKSVLCNYWFRRISVSLVRSNMRILLHKATLANDASKKHQASNYEDIEMCTINNPSL